MRVNSGRGPASFNIRQDQLKFLLRRQQSHKHLVFLRVQFEDVWRKYHLFFFTFHGCFDGISSVSHHVLRVAVRVQHLFSNCIYHEHAPLKGAHYIYIDFAENENNEIHEKQKKIVLFK